MALSKINTGGLAADAVDNTILDLADNFAFTGAVTGVGKILQVVTHIETDFTTFTNPGTARTDHLLIASNAADSTSHVSASITPSATSSKILIQVCVFYEGSTAEQEYLWDIHRDSTKLGSPKVGSRGGGIASASVGHVAANQDSTPETRFYQFVDSPSSTSAITYAASYNTSATSGSLHLNRTVTDSDSASYERGVSSIVLMEIAG
tara:strand:- start:3 stop:623 length:621 start_codon:yes stop_codon:yes gene_type:complete